MVAAGAVALVLAVLGASSAAAAQGAQPTGEAIEERDSLITAQESLLNVYRCRFDSDTIVVPGGCADGVPAEPAEPRPRFAGTPTWQEISQRDRLILSQEALLNVYRCLFSVDTSAVLGGCSGGRLASLPPAPDSCEFSEHAGNAIESVWQVQAGQSLGTAFHLGSAENRHWWMTAEHVVPSSGAVALTHSGRSISARVVVADRSGDIAVLSTEAGPNAELEFGGLAGSNPGATIFAVGYPLYLASTPSVSRGVVSRLFDDPALGLILQTDASVNPGNSGGPMLDACGRVAGMVVSKAAAEGTEGINYSITEDALRRALSDAQANPDQTPSPRRSPRPRSARDRPSLANGRKADTTTGGGICGSSPMWTSGTGAPSSMSTPAARTIGIRRFGLSAGLAGIGQGGASFGFGTTASTTPPPCTKPISSSISRTGRRGTCSIGNSAAPPQMTGPTRTGPPACSSSSSTDGKPAAHCSPSSAPRPPINSSAMPGSAPAAASPASDWPGRRTAPRSSAFPAIGRGPPRPSRPALGQSVGRARRIAVLPAWAVSRAGGSPCRARRRSRGRCRRVAGP